jgi:hypothetical protein
LVVLQKFKPLELQKGSAALQFEFPLKLTHGVGVIGAVAQILNVPELFVP